MAQVDFELDSRMTEETKLFTSQLIKTFDPDAITTTDLNVVRGVYDQMDAQRNSAFKFENLEEREFTVPNQKDGHQIPVTAYIPKNFNKKHPITVFIHGGGFCVFHRETYRVAICTLAEKSNCIWLSVEYRLSPEQKFPVPIEDNLNVVEWIAKNKVDLLKCDASAPVGVAGDSAGGLCAATISHSLKDLLSYQILIYPAVNSSMKNPSFKEFSHPQYLLTPTILEWFGKQFYNNEEERSLPFGSPMFYNDFKGLPQCLIIGVELDPLIDDAKEYAQKLTEFGVKNELKIIKGTIHGFFFRTTECKDAFQECSSYIVNYLENLKN